MQILSYAFQGDLQCAELVHYPTDCPQVRLGQTQINLKRGWLTMGEQVRIFLQQFWPKGLGLEVLCQLWN